ncbi:hypothetical protein P691DRAFT_283424 [Macrolepiota fuliginosa MF-IS2]|uniref:DUF6533 domain-containing protein n=1 Tax=Macrolepiota fuliginosa MF-IS2 TaxID=1400762 RepID=A0A9P6BYI4_9AGAR|nr:hypothetical protein P691DRAFT_283424 [Macrolepiota fuliginosa MF-IS2]
MTPNLIGEETELVSDVVRVLYLQHYCQLAALVITFYDHIITFDQELEMIWKKRWSKSKILYLMCRYIGDILILGETYLYLNQQPTDASLVGMWATRILAMIAFICTWTTQLILKFRITALYNSRLLSRCLTAVFVGGIISLIILGLLSLNGMQVISEPIHGIHQCTCTKLPPNAFMLWFPILFFDTLLFSLAIGIVVINWRRKCSQPLSPESGGPSLVAVLLRDNFEYFFLAFGIYLTTTVVWLSAKPQYFSIPACFSYSIVTVMGCRLILNLCDAYYNPDSHMARGTSEWDSLPPWGEPSAPTIGNVTHQANVAAPSLQIQSTTDAGSSAGSEVTWS